MKDTYKAVMDSVKAPSALVEKTLELMLAEHSKLKTKTYANSGYKKTDDSKASQKGTRWIANALLPTVACLLLYLVLIAPRLSSPDVDVYKAPIDFLSSPSLETQTPAGIKGNEFTETYTPDVTVTTPGNTELDASTLGVNAADEFSESAIEAFAIDNLPTRSGPATKYRETGSYQVKGENIRLLSFAYDENDICWVQCEVRYGDKLRRVYTGEKRFDTATFDLSSVPEETPPFDQAKVLATSKAMYGPGDEYDTYAELTVDEGQTVTIIAVENNYAQVEWVTSTQSYRSWVPIHMLNLI